jgi:hypothetical protein
VPRFRLDAFASLRKPLASLRTAFDRSSSID